MRKSGIDLLRIFAALGVTLIHYHDECMALSNFPTLNMITLIFMKSIGICSVDIFLVISGYFLINSDKRKLGKIVALILQVSVFNLFFLIGRHVFDEDMISFKSVIASMIPGNYFVILYATLYFISPYVNKLLNSLTPFGRKTFLIFSLFLFSLYPTLLDFTQELRGEKWWGVSTIGAWGNQQGFNIVNFILLYCVGALVKLDNLFARWGKRESLILSLSITIIVIFLWALFEENVTRFGMRSAWCYHNPFVILMAVLLFRVFLGLEFSNETVSRLGQVAFTSYLLNMFVLKHSSIPEYATQGVIIMMFHYVFVAIGIYFIAYLLHPVYCFFIKPIEDRLNKVKINYFEQ